MIVGCTAGGGTTFGNDDSGDGGAGASSSGGSEAGGSDFGTGGSFSGGLGVGGGGAGAPLVAEVYGHGPNILYKLDPLTNEVTEIGSFVGCSSVIDLAIDKDHNIYATTSTGLWSIDKNTATCTLIGGGSFPNSLSFVPEGTVDPSSEALVGYQGSNYLRIDTTTATVTTIGGITQGFGSSGDIVSVIGGGTYLTVTGNGCGDCLVEVNPATGDLVTNWGPVGYSAVYGLAFWGGNAYGFSNGGNLFEISFGASTVTTTPISIPSAPADLRFWGAGSATSAPLLPPE